MPVDNSDVTMEQYRMLRSEIVSLIDQTRKIEVLVIGAMGAFYSWMGTQENANPHLWYLATGLAVFGALRALGLFVRMGDISKYMILIEEAWETEDKHRHKGWERHFNSPGNNCFPLNWVTTILWLALIACSLVAPKLFEEKVGSSNPPALKEVASPVRATDASR